MSEFELPGLSAQRERFERLVDQFRPELHRSCSRMMGAAIDGEDVLQDTLAKAFFQLSSSTSMPPLKPWLLRIAHHTALDHLKRYERRHSEPLDDHAEFLADEAADPATIRAALSSFLALPVLQRSAVILKDVLGLSCDEIANALQTSVPTVKANRRGPEVSQYFGNYAKLCGNPAEAVELRVGTADGRVALGVFSLAKPGQLVNVVLLEVGPAGIHFIRDYRYVFMANLGDALTFNPLPAAP